MFNIRGRRTAQLCAAALLTAVATTGTVALAGSASADQSQKSTAVLGDFLHSGAVDVKGEGALDAGTVALTQGGQTMAVYCIDLHHGTEAGVKYTETGWDQSTLSDNPNRGKIQWILQHSYPVVSADALAKQLNVEGLSEDQAAAATQAAIWHFSDNADATPEDATAAQLTSWLETNAVPVTEPKPSLQLAPASVAGKSGEKIGPVTVTTSANSVDLSLTAPAGVSLVDQNGAAASKAVNGEKLYVKVPAGAAAGKATVTATTTTDLPVGRAFKAVDGSSQTMILAGTAPVEVTAAAEADWAPKGVIPAAVAKEDCTKGGVDVTLTNAGDQPWTTTVGGQSVTVQPGASTTVLVKVTEGATYDITVTGPNGFSQEFKGALKCKPTTPGTGPGPSKAPSSSATPSPSPSTGLAETGGGSGTSTIAGIAAALVVAGGAAVFVLRKRAKGTHAA
ncbi:Cys-Gln thioester bond-forming surface protein [Streptacidiphilus sp. EB129]|uniref:Cys-Gln thioester bond-forming surface protein n=1 Tax=Streptacidiphilus sp. EB129 TaxID=3156262 RepID=UPI003516702B